MKAMFGAGCFWHVQDAFSKVKGVKKAVAGYAGGDVKDPSYEQVSTSGTGHAEVVLVDYDPKKVSYNKLLGVFWKIHDPTQLNRQGLDVGSQYRSIIMYYDEVQKKQAMNSLKKQEEKIGKKIMTQIVKATPFYRAEEYHQDYFKKHGKTC